jgi:hypothetical protein
MGLPCSLVVTLSYKEDQKEGMKMMFALCRTGFLDLPTAVSTGSALWAEPGKPGA